MIKASLLLPFSPIDVYASMSVCSASVGSLQINLRSNLASIKIFYYDVLGDYSLEWHINPLFTLRITIHQARMCRLEGVKNERLEPYMQTVFIFNSNIYDLSVLCIWIKIYIECESVFAWTRLSERVELKFQDCDWRLEKYIKKSRDY